MINKYIGVVVSIIIKTYPGADVSSDHTLPCGKFKFRTKNENTHKKEMGYRRNIRRRSFQSSD